MRYHIQSSDNNTRCLFVSAWHVKGLSNTTSACVPLLRRVCAEHPAVRSNYSYSAASWPHSLMALEHTHVTPPATVCPCCVVFVQDTPAVKSSYSAAVRVPAALTALMSAVPTDTPPELPDGSTAAAGVPHLEGQQPPPGSSGRSDGSSGSRVFYFNQKVCIPSYLIALAVGQLEKRDLSER